MINFKRILKYNKSNSRSRQFEKERQRILNNAVSIGAILASILVPCFGFLDLLFKPHIFETFFIIRIGVIIITLIIFYLTKTPLGKKYPYLLGAFLTLVVGGSISLMCRLDLGPVDPYYAGINLPLLGFGILLPLTLWECVLVFFLVWLTYFVPNLLIVQPHEISMFISNNYFMISTIIIALVSSQFFLHYRKKQWFTHFRLESAHKKIKGHAKNLEKEVQERTQKLLQSERLAVVGQLAGGIAHDFNNILTVILGNSELILYNMDKSDPNRKDVESISRIGKRASDLVRKLLAFSRRQIMMPKEINLNDVIDEIKRMLNRVLSENIELIVNLKPNLNYVMADPVQIEQIILNLCVNARDAMPKGGTLIIETDNMTLDNTYCRKRNIHLPAGNYVMLAISDTGIGMNENIKSRIFEPFFTTKEKGHGTGLGLSSVFGIVKQSKGDIYVYSEEEKGTIFKIFFPCHELKPCTTDEDEEKLSKLPKGKETILLVEDEEEVRKLTARLLMIQGYKVIQANEGKEALTLSEKYTGSIDMLLTDIVMPQMDGKTLAKQISAKRNDIKVLFLSGYTSTMMKHQGLTNINGDFLQKPFTSEKLSKKIRHIFDNPAQESINN